MERPDGLVLGLALASQHELLAAWAQMRGLEIGQVRAPSLPTLEVSRVRRKTRQKSKKQLVPNLPGILALYPYEIYLQDAKVLETLALLEEELRGMPHVSALVLTSLYMHLAEPLLTATHDGHGIITPDNGWHRQCTLLLYNPEAACPLEETLRSSFEAMLTTVIDYGEPYPAC